MNLKKNQEKYYPIEGKPLFNIIFWQNFFKKFQLFYNILFIFQDKLSAKFCEGNTGLHINKLLR